MNNLFFAATGIFEKVFIPITDLLNEVFPYVLLVLGPIGSVWCIILGIKLAKAEEQQEREKAKDSLKNAIIGFALIFILIATLQIALPALTKWMNQTIVSGK